MTAAGTQRIMNIVKDLPNEYEEQVVSFVISLEHPINAHLQQAIDDDIDKTRQDIANGCKMYSVDESQDMLRSKYGF